ncbi:MAG: 16S rRNA (guanine(966)-N(2))-methyltransferase RsmD, partial [Porphyromonas pasteri]
KEIATLPQMILSSGLLKSDGVVVVEHPGTYDFSELPHFAEHREYGSVNFSIFTLAEDEEEGEAEE